MAVLNEEGGNGVSERSYHEKLIQEIKSYSHTIYTSLGQGVRHQNREFPIWFVC